MPENPRTGPERRRARRISIEGVQAEVMKVGLTNRIATSAIHPTPNIAIQLLDLSSGGMRILSWADMNVRERVIVKFSMSILSRKFSCRGLVKWKKPVQVQDKSLFELGIEYIDLPQEDRILLRQMEK